MMWEYYKTEQTAKGLWSMKLTLKSPEGRAQPKFYQQVMNYITRKKGKTREETEEGDFVEERDRRRGLTARQPTQSRNV